MSTVDVDEMTRNLDADNPAIGYAVKWAAQGHRVTVLAGIRPDEGTGLNCAPGWSCTCGDLKCKTPGKHPAEWKTWAEVTFSDPLELARYMRRHAYEYGAVNWARRLDPDTAGLRKKPGQKAPNVDALRGAAYVELDIDEMDAEGRAIMPDAIRDAMTTEDASHRVGTGKGLHLLLKLPESITIPQWRRLFGTDYYPDGLLENRQRDGIEKKGGPNKRTGEAAMRLVVGEGSRHRSSRLYELLTPAAGIPVMSGELLRVLCGPPDAALPQVFAGSEGDVEMPLEGVDTEARKKIDARVECVRAAVDPGNRNSTHNAQAYYLGLELRRHPHLWEYALKQLEKAAYDARRVSSVTKTGATESSDQSSAEATRAVTDGFVDGAETPLPDDLAAALEQGTPQGTPAKKKKEKAPAPQPAPQGTPQGTPESVEQGSPEVASDPAPEPAPQGTPEKNKGPQIVTRRLSEIGSSRPIPWLDCSIGEGRIPRGMATVIAGDPGVGKGNLAVLLAADVTRNGGTVLISSPEDNAHSVILPRMIAAGADISRVHLVGLAHDIEDPLAPFSMEVWATALAVSLEEHKPDLFIIDPLAEHIGTDTKDNKGTRDAIRPLLLACEKYGTALVLNAHVNRAESASWVKRITGSAAIGQIVRSVMLIGQLPKISPDQDDLSVPQLVALIHVKSNNGAAQPGLLFEIAGATVDSEHGQMTVSKMTLRGKWNGKEEDLLDERKRATYEAIGAAAYWLRGELSRGGVSAPRLVSEIHADAKATDTAWDEKIMRRAAKLIGAKNAPLERAGYRYYTLED